MTKIRILAASLVIMALWFASHCIILYRTGIPLNEAAIDAGVFATLLALGTWISGIILTYYRPDLRNISGILSGNAILTLGIILLYGFINSEILSREGKFTAYTSLVFITAFLLLSLFTYIFMLWSLEKERASEQKRTKEMEALSREAELAGLRLQLQPHFLFNSLNSISALLERDPQGARSMLHLLSDFLRGTIRKDPGQCISLSEELEHLRLYFEIEQVRFAGRLQVIMETDENCDRLQVPSLILQPLMENAIKHGLYGTSGPVTIALKCWEENNLALIRISNPYSPESQTSGTHFGLEAVNRRLQLMYGRPDLLQIQAEDELFTITIRIPQDL